MQLVKRHLLDEDNKRHGDKKTEGGKDGAEYHAGMNTSSYQFRCHNCGKEGHKRSECRVKGIYNRDRLEYDSKASGNMAIDDKRNVNRCDL